MITPASPAWSVMITASGLVAKEHKSGGFVYHAGEHIERHSRVVYRGKRMSTVTSKALKSFEAVYAEIEFHEIDIRIQRLGEVK